MKTSRERLDFFIPAGYQCFFMEHGQMEGLDEYTMWLEREKTGKNADKLEDSYADLMEKVKKVDPITIAETTGGQYKGDGVPRVVVQFLHSWLTLEFLPYRITAGHEVVDTLTMKVLFLHHVLAASENADNGVRVMGTWIDSRSLQHGAILGAHFSAKTNERLRAFFSLQREERIGRVLQWGGKPIDLGDEAYVFKFFPRLPVAFMHWKEDSEFAPYSKILFDVSASNYMPTHGLTTLTDFLVQRLYEGRG